VEQDRPAAAGRFARAAFDHQASREQRFDHLGGGGSRQVRAARDLGARNRALLPDQTQDRVDQRPPATGRGLLRDGRRLRDTVLELAIERKPYLWK
jgi:hypothetical protein